MIGYMGDSSGLVQAKVIYLYLSPILSISLFSLHVDVSIYFSTSPFFSMKPSLSLPPPSLPLSHSVVILHLSVTVSDIMKAFEATLI